MSIYIVGIGPGHKDYILPKAIEVLKQCDIIVGFERAISSIRFINTKSIIISSLKDVIEAIKNHEDKNIGVVASGDPTFYGITNYLSKEFNDEIEVIPGISSFQYLTCKLNKSWNNGFVGSLHGREDDFISKVKEYKLSIWLTDKKNDPASLCGQLLQANINCTVAIGENLSYEDEVITIGQPKELSSKNYGELSIFIVENI